MFGFYITNKADKKVQTMINPIMNVSFKSNANNRFEHIPSINENYTTTQSKANTVTELGSSKTKDPILKYMDLCSQTTKELVKSGVNISTGCGSHGIMGAAYNAAKESSAKDSSGRPVQNLAIVMEPAWGDEDIDNCVPIGKASSEAERIAKFTETSDSFIIYAGSATTLQEAASLIQKNEYTPEGEPLKKIILVGKDFYAGLDAQYKKLYESQLLKHSPDELYTICDTKEEILKALGV